jgi:hypothetical protein
MVWTCAATAGQFERAVSDIVAALAIHFIEPGSGTIARDRPACCAATHRPQANVTEQRAGFRTFRQSVVTKKLDFCVHLG